MRGRGRERTAVPAGWRKGGEERPAAREPVAAASEVDAQEEKKNPQGPKPGTDAFDLRAAAYTSLKDVKLKDVLTSDEQERMRDSVFNSIKQSMSTVTTQHEAAAGSASPDACAVCIDDIARDAAVWSCPQCFGVFHLVRFLFLFPRLCQSGCVLCMCVHLISAFLRLLKGLHRGVGQQLFEEQRESLAVARAAALFRRPRVL